MVLKLGHSSQSPEEGFVKALIAGPHPHISDSGVKPENLHFCFNFLAVLDRHRLARAFSSCGEQGLLSSCGARASSLWRTGSGRAGFRAQAQ